MPPISRPGALSHEPARGGAAHRARIALVDAAAEPHPTLARLALAWSGGVLPAILLGTGAVYAWGAVVMIGRIFVS